MQTNLNEFSFILKKKQKLKNNIFLRFKNVRTFLGENHNTILSNFDLVNQVAQLR